jgi:hypothetical protein
MITKNNTIKNAVMQEVFAIDFLADLSLSPTKPKKTGVFATGFIMAKNPVKTVKEKVKILFVMAPSVYKRVQLHLSFWKIK